MTDSRTGSDRRLLLVAGWFMIAVGALNLVLMALRGGTGPLLGGIGLIAGGVAMLLAAHRSTGTTST